MYHAARNESVEQEVFRNAIVKGYELCQETILKLLRDILQAHTNSSHRLEQLTIREQLQMAISNNLMTPMEVERWHIYHEKECGIVDEIEIGISDETLILLPQFIQDCHAFIKRL